MRRTRLALSVLALPFLTACGHAATSTTDPFAANDAGTTCRIAHYGSSLLVGETVRLTRSVTVKAMTAEDNVGIRIGQPQASRLSIDTPEDGSWAGKLPTEPARSRLNWDGRTALLGTQLAAGWYELWWTASATSANAAASGWAIGWTDSNGASGAHRIAQALRFNAGC